MLTRPPNLAPGQNASAGTWNTFDSTTVAGTYRPCCDYWLAVCLFLGERLCYRMDYLCCGAHFW